MWSAGGAPSGRAREDVWRGGMECPRGPVHGRASPGQDAPPTTRHGDGVRMPRLVAPKPPTPAWRPGAPCSPATAAGGIRPGGGGVGCVWRGSACSLMPRHLPQQSTARPSQHPPPWPCAGERWTRWPAACRPGPAPAGWAATHRCRLRPLPARRARRPVAACPPSTRDTTAISLPPPPASKRWRPGRGWRRRRRQRQAEGRRRRQRSARPPKLVRSTEVFFCGGGVGVS